MAYLFYSTVLALIVFSSSLVLTRDRWLPLLFAHPPSFTIPGSSTASHLYSRIPNFANSSPSTFLTDVEAGLHSANFNLAENIEGEDGRAGLDDQGKKEVLRIMRKNKKTGMNFDEAREVFMQERFSKMGIAADGRPRDPKFVSFS